MKRGPAVFVDRDGVINALVHYPDFSEWESPREPSALRLLDGVEAALRELRNVGMPVFLVSNQPSFAKGKTSLENLQAVHDRLIEELASQDASLTGAYYCFHHPNAVVPEYAVRCSCRKPAPGLLQEAAASRGLDLEASWMIGDQDSDVQSGAAAGCRTILIPNQHSAAKRGHSIPTAVAKDLSDAVRIILQAEGKNVA